MKSFSDIPPLNAAALLKRHGLHPDRRLGQNFLQDPLALADIARAADLHGSDTVLEIGAGLGGLTRYLALASREVLAIELDGRLFEILKAILAAYPNVRIIQADILKINPSEFIGQTDYIVAANIPYYITSAVIRHLLEGHPKPRRVVLTVQQEVAQRICASPGDLSLLALSVQVFGKPESAVHIPARAFFPVPKVDSTVVRIEIYPAPLIQPRLLTTFFRLTRAGFSQKRKVLRNSLSAGLGIKPVETEALLERAGIDPRRRAETLSIPEWATLSALIKKVKPTEPAAKG